MWVEINCDFEANRGEGQRATVIGCGFKSYYRISNEQYFNFFSLVTRQSVALSYATYLTTPQATGGKCEAEAS